MPLFIPSLATQKELIYQEHFGDFGSLTGSSPLSLLFVQCQLTRFQKQQRVKALDKWGWNSWWENLGEGNFFPKQAAQGNVFSGGRRLSPWGAHGAGFPLPAAQPRMITGFAGPQRHEPACYLPSTPSAPDGWPRRPSLEDCPGLWPPGPPFHILGHTACCFLSEVRVYSQPMPRRRAHHSAVLWFHVWWLKPLKICYLYRPSLSKIIIKMYWVLTRYPRSS